MDNKKNNSFFGKGGLKGRILEIPLTPIPKEDIWEMGEFTTPKTTRVTETAVIKCSCSSGKGALMGIPQAKLFEKGNKVATIKDGIGGKNILPMGKCSILKSSCKPSTVSWVGGSKNTNFNGIPLLLSSDKLFCKVGGVIEILETKGKTNQV